MQFHTQIRSARITYAVLVSVFMCVVMSVVSTSVLRPIELFWQYWPKLLAIDLAVAIPVAVLIGPVIRRICLRLYPDLPR